jgi:hypothetical protein
MKTFFLCMGRMGYPKIRLFILISKCTFDLCKKCTQKMLCPENRIFSWQNSFSAKTFLGCTFYKNQIYIFETRMKIEKTVFYTHSPYLNKKVFIS